VTQALSGFGGVPAAAGINIRCGISALDRRIALPTGIALLRPVYAIGGALAAGAALYVGGIEALTITIAGLVALWAFAEPRTALWLVTAFMIFLFVFFQSTAPLGEELPGEFLNWGIGVALITSGLLIATLFSSQADWGLARRRMATAPGLAIVALLIVILASAVDGLVVGNQFFVVARQLFGCLLLPIYFLLCVALLRTPLEVDRWMRCVSWVIALGSVWYVQRISLLSLGHGSYYREQSPLVAYGGAVAVAAWAQLVQPRRIALWVQSLAQFMLCVMAILLMGSRTAFGSVLAAIAGVTGLALWRRRGFLIALTVFLIPIGFGVAQYGLTGLVENRGLTGQIAGRFIFVLSEDRSYQGRVLQTEVVLNMVNERPILGAGMGSVNSFFMPGEHRVKVASVDNGWGFLLLKMGYLGLAVFLILVGMVLRTALSGLPRLQGKMLRVDRLAALGVFLYALVSFLSGPIFFHFSAAPFFGTFLGVLVTLGDAREGVRHVPAEDGPA
jgi:O-antigen ligase